MKINRLAIGLAVGALALAGCAGTSPSKDRGTDSSGKLSAVPGFDPEEGVIRVGNLLPLSGPLATAGQDTLLGTQLYIDRINAAGGIAGKYQVKLVNADTKYDPQTALSAYNGLADDVVMLGSVLGTAITGALLPQAQADDMLMIQVSDTSAYLRKPNVLLPRPTYEAYVVNGLAYLAEHGGQDKKVCGLLQDDPYGENFRAAAGYAVDKLGLNYTKEVRFATTNSDFTPQISQLKSAGCEIVIWGGTIGTTTPAMTSAVQLNFTPQWLSLNNGFGEHLLSSPLADYLVKNWTISSSGVQWGDESVPGMAQLLEDFEKYAPAGTKPNPNAFIPGYEYGIATETLLTEAVKRGDLSHASIVEISQSGLTLDFKGLAPTVTLEPATERTPASSVTIYAVDPTVLGGLRVKAVDFDSEAAKSYAFD